MMNRKIGFMRLFSGLFLGVIEGGIQCFVVRDRPEEALQDAEELKERYNGNNQIR